MRHTKLRRKLSRTPAHRKALFRNLSTALLRHEQCLTTLEKAKALRPIVEKLITLARSNTLHARRRAYAYVESKEIVHKLFTEIAPRYMSCAGGYTRVIRTAYRHGDAAPMAVIELVAAKTAPAAKKSKASRNRKESSAANESKAVQSE